MSECSSNLQKFIFTFTIDTFHQVTILVEKSKAGKKKKRKQKKNQKQKVFILLAARQLVQTSS